MLDSFAPPILKWMLASLGSSWKCPQVSLILDASRGTEYFSYHLLSRSKLLSRHIWNWSLTPNSTDSFLLMDDSWQCVPCHRSGLWLSVSHAANESSFGVLDNTYSSLALWVRGLGGVDLGIWPPCLSMLQSEREPRLLLSQNQLPGWLHVCWKARYPQDFWSGLPMVSCCDTWAPVSIQSHVVAGFFSLLGVSWFQKWHSITFSLILLVRMRIYV